MILCTLLMAAYYEAHLRVGFVCLRRQPHSVVADLIGDYWEENGRSAPTWKGTTCLHIYPDVLTFSVSHL